MKTIPMKQPILPIKMSDNDIDLLRNLEKKVVALQKASVELEIERKMVWELIMASHHLDDKKVYHANLFDRLIEEVNIKDENNNPNR